MLCTVIVVAITVQSMVADLVEDAELRNGRRAEGIFFAASLFGKKMILAFGTVGAGVLLFDGSTTLLSFIAFTLVFHEPIKAHLAPDGSVYYLAE